MTLNRGNCRKLSVHDAAPRIGRKRRKETIERQEGTCRDFALLTMKQHVRSDLPLASSPATCTCRAGIATRVGAAARHTRGADLPSGLGWVEFDSTERHCRRLGPHPCRCRANPRQAIPLSGLIGAIRNELAIDVSVQVKTEANVLKPPISQTMSVSAGIRMARLRSRRFPEALASIRPAGRRSGARAGVTGVFLPRAAAIFSICLMFGMRQLAGRSVMAH